ncbi:glycosyltransferase family 4 protein [Candidatus Woesearchaeota archaeon]|nr:glycosyltransferase family 4 protein [Candidatus Woesearchaeota archaeon]
MNICYVNPTNNIRRPIAELAKLLANKGHQITIMYPESKQCPTKNWIANDITKNPNIKTVPIKSYYISPLRYSIPNIFHLLKQIKKIYRTNHKIHIWEYYYPLSVIPLLYAALNRNRKNKTILTTDGFVGYSYKPKYLTLPFKIYTQLIARFLFKIPKTLTTYGKPLLPHAKKAGVPKNKLKILSTGIHLNQFKKTKHQLKKEFNITNEKVILFAGMLTERKGVKKVIQISHQLLRENHNIKTLIVGDAHGKNEYQKLTKHKNIIFTGGRKDISQLMQLADILILPSEGEGLPGVVMEAMASKLPVIASYEGCTPDLIENGKEGFLVKRDYLSATRTLLNNKKLRKQFSHRAHQKIKQFDWNLVAKKYENLYHEIN